jgi:hypothetical protein
MLLKVGIVMMTFALALAALVALIAFYDEPMERAVAEKKPAAEPSVPRCNVLESSPQSVTR